MTPEEKSYSKRVNEQFKAGASFLYNVALASFVAGFALWYSGSNDTYWILAGALGGLVGAGFAIGILNELRAEE